MKKLLAALIFFALSSAALAQSSYTFIDAGGTTRTVKSVNCTPICPMTVPVDSLGVPIWGTAGAANSNVMSVQGIASGTPIPISVGTVTVTGTVTANLGTLNGAATAGNQTTLITNLGSPFQAGASIGNTSFAVTQPVGSQLNATVVGTGTFATQLTGATNNINNIAGAITLPTGAATAAKQPALGTAGSSSIDVISIQGIASGTAVPISGTVSIAANQSVNVAQVAGTSTSTGSGTMSAGTQRMALATDSPGIITLGQTTMSASVPVAIASNQSALATSIADGSNVTQGALADASATAGSVGSISAKLRLITTQLDAITTAATGAIPPGTNTIGTTGQLPYPVGATPITASATGTTSATTATLAGTLGKTTYICGYSIRANATAATTVTNTITGIITATLSSIMWIAPAASGIGIDEQIFSPCIPASATNTGIAIVSGAPGSGGLVSSKGWGYQL